MGMPMICPVSEARLTSDFDLHGLDSQNRLQLRPLVGMGVQLGVEELCVAKRSCLVLKCVGGVSGAYASGPAAASHGTMHPSSVTVEVESFRRVIGIWATTGQCGASRSVPSTSGRGWS